MPADKQSLRFCDCLSAGVFQRRVVAAVLIQFSVGIQMLLMTVWTAVQENDTGSGRRCHAEPQTCAREPRSSRPFVHG
jgi:hypothetical protein